MGSNSVPDSGTAEQFHRLKRNWIWHSSTASFAPLATLAIRVGCLRQRSLCFVLSCGVVKHMRAVFFAGSVESGVWVPNVLAIADQTQPVKPPIPLQRRYFNSLRWLNKNEGKLTTKNTHHQTDSLSLDKHKQITKIQRNLMFVGWLTRLGLSNENHFGLGFLSSCGNRTFFVVILDRRVFS